MLESVLDNDGGNDHVAVVNSCTGAWKNVILRNGHDGVVVEDAAVLQLEGVRFTVYYARAMYLLASELSLTSF